MKHIIALACGIMASVQVAQADTITLDPAKDNTLYEEPNGLLSNGAGEYFFAGKTGSFNQFRVRRGLIAFDIAGGVPKGASITGATLTLHLSAAAPGSGNQPIALHRLTADWGEGESDAGVPGGSGALAMAGDATWLHTFFDTDLWKSPGGDFDSNASATSLTGTALGEFPTWSSTEMIADVQTWLDDPTTNFGWLLFGNESEAQTARRFDTRENVEPSFRPMLEIEFEASNPCPWDLDSSGVVGSSDLLALLIAWGPNPGHPADFNGDDNVGSADLLALLINWGPCP